MKANTWGAAVAIVLGGAVAAFAQSGSSTTAGPAGSSVQVVTAAGCLQQADQVPSGTTSPAGTTGSTPSRSASGGGSNFVLTSAHAPANGTRATGTSGTVGTSSSNASRPVRSTYFLDGSQDLASAIGHEVEVIGTVDREINSRLHGTNADTAATHGTAGTSGSGSTETEGASTMTSGGAAGAKSLSTWEHLRVTSVRTIANSCSSK